MVSSKEKSSHFLKFHYLTECCFCKDQIQYWEKESHKCSVSFIECGICQLQVLHVEFQAHYHRCEARTTQCHQCKKYLNYIEMGKHQLEDCMPSIKQAVVTAKKQQAKCRKNKKKNKWVSLGNIIQTNTHKLRPEDFDRQVAEDIFEEIINDEIAEEERYDCLTKF